MSAETEGEDPHEWREDLHHRIQIENRGVIATSETADKASDALEVPGACGEPARRTWGAFLNR